jgi:hypothetical protein
LLNVILGLAPVALSVVFLVGLRLGLRQRRMRPQRRPADVRRYCETCRYWCGPDGSNAGTCRRNSPYFPTDADDEADYWKGDVAARTRTLWPLTIATDWCGEWERSRQKTGS